MVQAVGAVGGGLAELAKMVASVLSVGECKAIATTGKEGLDAGVVEIAGECVVSGVV